MIVQIYGITTPADAAMVNALRPDNVGVVLDEGVDTWDSVDEATMRSMLGELANVTVVALSLATEGSRMLRTAAAVEPGIVHLARAADHMTPEQVGSLRDKLDPVRMMVTIPVRDEGAIAIAQRFASVTDYLLLDTAHPETGIVGATGFVHDWWMSRRIVEAVDVPVILAGGLGPENVADAIREVSPAGVDSETRTSRADDRRRKDPVKVRQFIERARGSEGARGN